jgi:hypothetical protein
MLRMSHKSSGCSELSRYSEIHRVKVLVWDLRRVSERALRVTPVRLRVRPRELQIARW